MRVSVASVGLNPLLPKNPATNLPARSFRGLSFMFFLPSSLLFPTGKEKLDHQWPASLLKSSVSKLTARIPCLPPSKKWPGRLKAQEGGLSLILPYSSDGAGGKQQLYGPPHPACSPTPDGMWASWDISLPLK